MSYPNYPGYPPTQYGPPGSNGYPPASGGGGIGFESLMRPAQPSPAYGQPAAPYPTGQMPFPGYGSPQPPVSYGAPPGMPSRNAPPAHMPIPAAPLTFGHAAHAVQATVAFQAPFGRMPTPNPNVSYRPAAANVFPGVTPPAQPSHNPHHHDSRVPTQVNPTSSSGKPVRSASTPPSNSGTVKPHPNFNPEVDAATIRKAVAGFGTNVKEIINILFTRTNSQRLKIALEYKTSLGRDLSKDVEHALGGSLEKLLKGLLQTPAEYDASELRDAMKGAGTNESVLIEILCSRTNAEIVTVKQQYMNKFNRDLEKDVQSETSSHFRKFLTSLLQANRDETNTVDYTKARADADALHKAGEKRWGTDESRFNVIFASRSYAQLRETFNEYAKISKFDIEKSVEREMSGDLKNAMTVVVQCVRNTPDYFAMKLYKSMKGVGTDDGTLIRIIVSRCEVDMVLIKQEFQKRYQKTLASFIKGDTSGNYCKTLLGLIGESKE